MWTSGWFGVFKSMWWSDSEWWWDKKKLMKLYFKKENKIFKLKNK